MLLLFYAILTGYVARLTIPSSPDPSIIGSLLPSKCAATAANVDGNQMIRKKCGNICLYCLTVPTYGQIPIKCVRNRSYLLITLIKCQVLPTQNFAFELPQHCHTRFIQCPFVRKELPTGFFKAFQIFDP